MTSNNHQPARICASYIGKMLANIAWSTEKHGFFIPHDELVRICDGDEPLAIMSASNAGLYFNRDKGHWQTRVRNGMQEPIQLDPDIVAALLDEFLPVDMPAEAA